MALNAFFTFTCPSCGAKGSAFSATSVLMVCEYCQSTLVRSGEGVEDTGKKSALLEDFSPLQLYTTGIFQGDPFTIIGALQIQYRSGFWKEWYILFADGQAGWLADFSGQYVITRLGQSLKKPLPFDQLIPGLTTVGIGNAIYTACDVRKATSVKANARGELPFKLQEDEVVLAADFRYRNLFVTLDYSESSETPLVYQGKAVNLKDLRCQNLRTDDQIKATAGQLKGQRASLSCPNCGAPMSWYPGAAQTIICQSCRSKVNLDEGKARVMRTHQMRNAQQEVATLKLGEIGKINGAPWAVIGMVRVHETLPVQTYAYIRGGSTLNATAYEASFWHEYLLYNPQKGFMWLVESDGKWDLSHAPDTWPDMVVQAEQVIPLQQNKKSALPKLYDYGGQVQYAAGAFYWDIEPGDVTYYQDYRYDTGKLCAERTREELNWSVSKPVTGAELAEWFKRPELARAVKTQRIGSQPNYTLAVIMLIVYGVLNLPALLASLSGSSDTDFGLITLAITTFIVYKVIFNPFESDDD